MTEEAAGDPVRKAIGRKTATVVRVEAVTTGRPLVEKVTMLGAWACGGRAALARSRLLERLCRAAILSMPSLSCTVTTDAPDVEVESTLVTPETPWGALTTGRVTCWSTTPGEAPE